MAGKAVKKAGTTLFLLTLPLMSCTKNHYMPYDPSFEPCFNHCVDGGVKDLQKTHENCSRSCKEKILNKKKGFTRAA